MAPVGSPEAFLRSGSAWKARYRYDDPSTSTSVLSGEGPESGILDRRGARLYTSREPMTHKIPKPLTSGGASQSYFAAEAWRLFGIMSEFVEATERMNEIRPAVSVFGSARVPEGHPYYVLAERT